MSAAGSYRCTICRRFAAPSLNGVLKHIGTIHSHEPHFRVVCGVNDCPKAYNNYHSFRKHLRRKHPEYIQTSRPSITQTNQFCSLDEDEFQESEVPYRSEFSSTQFLLKCKEVGQIPQGVLNDLISDITLLVNNSLESMSSEVRATLESNNICVEDIAGLEGALQADSFRKPFKGLESEYLQKKAFHSLGVVVSVIILFQIAILMMFGNVIIQQPVERVLGSSFGNSSSSRHRFKLTSDCAYDIPLKESLQQLLSNTLVFKEVYYYINLVFA